MAWHCANHQRPLICLRNHIGATNKDKATPEQLTKAREAQRRCGYMIDFIVSENSMGFHAPQEAQRILGDAINHCRVGQIALHGGPAPIHASLAPAEP